MLKEKALFIFVLFLFSCRKDKVEPINDFKVSILNDTSNIKVGDTVFFTFSGANPDNIVFYSGEQGSNYYYKNRPAKDGISKIVFRSSYLTYVTSNPNDTVKIYLLADMNGKFDTAALSSVKKIDITDLNTKWPTSASANYTVSDTITVTEKFLTDNFGTTDAKFHFAVRYFSNKRNDTFTTLKRRADTIVSLRRWNFDTIKVFNVGDDGFLNPQLNPNPTATNPVPRTNFASSDLIHICYKVPLTVFYSWNLPEAGYSYLTDSYNAYGIKLALTYPITIDPSSTKTNWRETDDWAITGLIDLHEVQSSVGYVVKNNLDNQQNVFGYVYTKNGYYQPQFLVTSAKGSIKKQIITDPIPLNVK